jgi:hypothetical protein
MDAERNIAQSRGTRLLLLADWCPRLVARHRQGANLDRQLLVDPNAHRVRRVGAWIALSRGSGWLTRQA